MISARRDAEYRKSLAATNSVSCSAADGLRRLKDRSVFIECALLQLRNFGCHENSPTSRLHRDDAHGIKEIDRDAKTVDVFQRPDAQSGPSAYLIER